MKYATQKLKYKDKNNPNYKDGRKINPNFCIDCNIKIDYRSKRCHKCANKIINNSKRIFSYCQICRKLINLHSKYCRHCYLNLLRNKKPHNYKGIIYKCIDCGKKIYRGFKRCKSCSRIQCWKESDYRERQLIAQRKGMQLNPNKPEKLLDNLLRQLLPKEYKFVGDGKVILGGFNPDFININGQKKIIEMYGDYWHNRPEVKERDKRRLIVYKKYGYKTLIVWEKELRNRKNIINKIKRF